jgi:CelD/BcsL family acetyltransferase involved in cellulose biosynthesis
LLRIDVINNEEELSRIAEEWSDLLPQSQNDTIFLTFEWLSTWCKYFRDRKEVRVLIFRDEEGRFIGIAPLLFFKYRYSLFISLKFVEFIGTNHSDYLDFIVLKGRESEFFESFFGYLKEHSKEWDVLNLLDIPEHSTTLHRIAESRLKYRSRIISLCPFMTLPEKWNSYLSSLSKKRRKNLQYYLSRLKREFSIQFGVVDENDMVQEKMEKLFSIHENRWRDKGWFGGFSDDRSVQFHKDIALKFLKKGWLRLYYLSLDEKIAAMLYAFKYNHKFMYYQAGFDPEYSRYSVATVLLVHCIENAFKEGMREFDFLRGNESYKYDWGSNQARKNIHCQAYNSSCRVWTYRFLSAAEIRLKNAIIAILPRDAVLGITRHYRETSRRFFKCFNKKMAR